MTITALPTAPQTTDTQAVFNTRAFAFVAALNTFGTEANALATTVNGYAAAALSYKTLAASWAAKTDGQVDATDYSAKAWAVGGTGVTGGAGSSKEWASKMDGAVAGTDYSAKYYSQQASVSAAAAASAANSVVWVSGTTYAAGDVRYSPVNFQSYRRLIAGAGTTDPSLDTTNWTQISGGGDVDGPASAADNAIARYDGTTGKLIQSTGLSIDDSNNLTGVDALLTRMMLQDTGWDFHDSGATATINYVNGSVQRWAPTAASNPTLTISNWPPSGAMGELLIEGVNLGAAGTITFPTANWLKSDGTFAASPSAANITLQSSGIDFILLWTRDGGTTIYAKVMR